MTGAGSKVQVRGCAIRRASHTNRLRHQPLSSNKYATTRDVASYENAIKMDIVIAVKKEEKTRIKGGG